MFFSNIFLPGDLQRKTADDAAGRLSEAAEKLSRKLDDISLQARHLLLRENDDSRSILDRLIDSLSVCLLLFYRGDVTALRLNKNLQI